jgi:hypothetical protein
MIQLMQLRSSTVLPYIKDELSQGGEFSSFFSMSDLVNGIVFSYLPSHTDLNELLRFDQSFELRTGVKISNHVEQITVEIMYKYINENSKNCIVFESIRRTSDTNFRESNVPYFSINERVYYFLQKGFSKEEILRCMYSATSYPRITLCMEVPNMRRLSTCLVLERDSAKQMAKRVKCIMVGAFDDEGYVFWVPKTERNFLETLV